MDKEETPLLYAMGIKNDYKTLKILSSEAVRGGLSMNLLVLGNGFDLLHSLPTTYKDFIDFTTLFRMSLEKE